LDIASLSRSSVSIFPFEDVSKAIHAENALAEFQEVHPIVRQQSRLPTVPINLVQTNSSPLFLAQYGVEAATRQAVLLGEELRLKLLELGISGRKDRPSKRGDA